MTTTPSTASQAPEVLTRQVAAWRAEVARLNDLIAHATGASQAPAVSICPLKAAGLPAEEAEAFIAAMAKWHFSRPGQEAIEKFDAVVAVIDAKLAQAREGGRLDGYNKGWADASLTLIKAESRATAAEAKLEAIRQRAEGLDEIVVKRDVLALFTTPPKADESGLPG